MSSSGKDNDGIQPITLTLDSPQWLASAISTCTDPLAACKFQWDRFESAIAQCMMVAEAIVQDYPIGSGYRGQCKLGYDYDPRKGWRLVRTTTNKNGRWCQPHKSTYSHIETGGGPIVVLVDKPNENNDRADGSWMARSVFQSMWLRCSLHSGPYFTLPNYDHADEDRLNMDATCFVASCQPPFTSMPDHDHHPNAQYDFDLWQCWIARYRNFSMAVKAESIAMKTLKTTQTHE